MTTLNHDVLIALGFVRQYDEHYPESVTFNREVKILSRTVTVSVFENDQIKGQWGISNSINEDIRDLNKESDIIDDMMNIADDILEDFHIEDDSAVEDRFSDVEADSMTLRDAGMGCDEDYGHFGGDE